MGMPLGLGRRERIQERFGKHRAAIVTWPPAGPLKRMLFPGHSAEHGPRPTENMLPLIASCSLPFITL